MVLLDVVYLSMNWDKSYGNVTPKLMEVLITHKYRGSQQFLRVEFSTQIHRFDTRGAKEYL